MDIERRDFLRRCGAFPALLPAAAWLAESSTAAAADQPVKLEPAGANLGTLFDQVERLAGPTRYPLSFLSGRFAAWDECRAAARERIFELLAYRPEKVDPRPEVVERVELADHVREKVLFSTGPQLRVPAYVLIPKGLRNRAPAIIDLHSHGGMFVFGKEKVIDLGPNHPVMTDYHQRNYDGQPTATALVRRGYVVISIDAFFFGERRLLLDEDHKFGFDRAQYSRDDVLQLNQKCRGKESTLVKALVFAGLTWPGIVFWDDIRTVDYLVTRPEVDPQRIGCQGISMGGYRTIYLAGLDDRIRAANIVGFMSTVAPMRKAHLDTHSWVHFLPEIHRWMDLPDVAALAAPRALLVQQCSQDRLFPLAAMQESVDKIAAVYAKAGVPNQFSGRFYDAPHQFTRAMQEEAFAWFDRHL